MPDDVPATPTPTPAAPRKRRRWLRWLLAVAGLAAVIAVSSPWWTPPLARYIANRVDGVTIGEIETRGLSRWTVRSVEARFAGTVVTVEEADIPSPLGWLWSKLNGNLDTEHASIDDWRVTLPQQDTPEKAAKPPTLASIVANAKQALNQVGAYIGPLQATDGVVENQQGELARIDSVSLDQRRLDARFSLLGRQIEASVDASDSDQWTATIDDRTDEAQVAVTLDLGADSFQATGEVSAYGNQATYTAEWSPSQTGFIPDSARVNATRLQLDDRLPFWNAAPPLVVDAYATWKSGAYTFAIDSSSDDAEQTIHLAGGGTLDGLSIERGSVELPWLELQTDAPVKLDFSLRNPLENANLALLIDLGRLPWIQAAGQVRAELATATTDDGQPRLYAKISGADVSLQGVEISSLAIQATAIGRSIEIASLSLEEEAGSSVTASGIMNLDTRTIERSAFSVTMDQSSTIAQRFLSFASWTSLEANGTASGELVNPDLKANAKIAQFETSQTPATDLTLELSGTITAVECAIEAVNPNGELRSNFTLNRNATSFDATITKLEITSMGAKALELLTPATAKVDAKSGVATLSGLTLDGPAGSKFGIPNLRLSPESLEASAYATSIAPQMIQPWLKATIPAVRILELDVQARMSEKSTTIQTSGEAVWRLSETNTVEASWRASQPDESNPQLTIDHIEIGAAGRSFLRAKGTLPLSVAWANGKPTAKLDDASDFSVSVESSPHPEFWKSAAALLPFSVSKPTISAQLSGTMQSPSGQANARFSAIEWKSANDPNKRVSLSDINISLLASEDMVELKALSARVGKNTIQAEAKLPVRGATIPDLIKQRRPPSLSDLEGNAEISIVDFPALSAWMPPIMRDEGSVTLSFQFSDESAIGTARIENVATRPLPPLGSISKIAGDIQFENGLWKLGKITGVAEQSPFTLTGSVDLNKPTEPKYDLAFTSESFPLVRGNGVMLTGDIDLKLATNDGAPPTLSGKVGLTKGLVLVEPDLLASQTKTSRQQPPYFSVSAEPFNDWGLDVTIQGERFLRVSNTFFQGTLSADFLLDGTLGSPLLIGKARADNGRINFPATTLQLASGEANITRERPTEITIEATANGRIYPYDINLVASGTIEDPEVTITTSPALTQAEALLLVTTGAAPDSQTSLAQQSATSLGLFIGKGLFRKLMPQGGGDSANRFSLEVGNDISLQGKRTVEATYQLTETLEIEGEYDRRDEYNANLKWTFYKR